MKTNQLCSGNQSIQWVCADHPQRTSFKKCPEALMLAFCRSEVADFAPRSLHDILVLCLSRPIHAFLDGK